MLREIGKSSITLRLVRSQWTHEYDPTIEDSYSVTRTVDGLPYFLALTDTAGQEEYRGLWAAQNLKSDAFLLVYDITNAATLETLDYFMEMIDIEAEQRLEDNARLIEDLGDAGNQQEPVAVGMAPPVKIVAGNKCDLKDERVVGARQGLEYARSHGCGFMETSAREMVNIEETFALIVRRVVEARRLHFLQQHPHLYQRPGYSFFSPGTVDSPLALHSPADSHSRTPALTAREQEISDDIYNNRDKPHSRASQWLGLDKVLSKHVGKKRKSAATASEKSRRDDHTATRDEDDASRRSQKEKKRSDSHSERQQPQEKRGADDSQNHLQGGQPATANEENNSNSWWKNLVCCGI
ncbi:hypothetical protein AJ80_05329 [Polytolypa hystricis UAMH7299]|uniref:Uncharacterized protein n=1 Tax=Polytolypa hystricis (strain UAMH7299) TaxID=1447883 RepID=A0A2B7XWG1_POLH7|nr:hypothetical protein AJ80_05329 [Polytolypa hystricis UAMH7299]